jgi:RND family efflux transporter MFP subunit
VDYKLAVTLAKAKIKNSESLLKLAEEQTAAAKEEWRLHRTRGSRANVDPPPLVAKEPQLEAARAKLEADKADLQKALLHLERTNLKAPFNGRVSQENVDIGQFVSPGQALASLYSTEAAEIVLPMEDEDLFWFRVPGFTPNKGAGSPALVKARIAGRNQTWEGQVVRTEGILDERTRLIDVVVRVNKPYAKKPPLAVGLFVTVDIRGSTLPNATLIPRSALRSGNVVWILDEEEKLRFREVGVAKFQDDHVIVKAGLEGTEKLIISPLKAVTDGMKVRGQLIEMEEKS